jgi:Xaa-Pro dipeptidase
MNDFAFPVPEFEQRLSAIRRKMQERNLDAIIILRPENIFYASGFRAAHIAFRTAEFPALIVPAKGDVRLMTRSLEAEATKMQWTPRPVLYKDQEDPYAMLLEVLKESKSEGGRIGIEERVVKLSQFKKAQAKLPNATFVDMSGLIESVSAAPSDLEAACMKQAAKISEIGFKTGVAAIKEGAYAYEIIGKIHQAMYAAGQSDFDKSLVAVWSGPKGGRMHDTNATERVKPGDVATIEIMGVDKYYRAGVQGCIYIGGTPPKAISEAHDLVVAMHAAAKAAVNPGAKAGDVFAAANAVYRAAKGVDYYRRCGGSMGLTQFTIDLVKDRQDVLTPGVSLLIQTLVDDPVLLTCASTVVVTEDGHSDLTQTLGAKMMTA